MSKNRLFNALDGIQSRKQNQRDVIPAVLGRGDTNLTVEVENHPGKHWIRLYGDLNQIAVAKKGTAAVHGLSVNVAVNTDETTGRRSYEVIGVNDIIYDSGNNDYGSYIEEHASTHEWPTGAPGRDPVNVYPRAFGFGRVYPTSPASMRCGVSPIQYAHQADLRAYAGGYTKDFTADVPATGLAVLILVVLDGATNALDYVTGTEFSWAGWTGAVIPAAALPDPVAGQLALSQVLLYGGMTSITEVNFKYERRLPFSTLGNPAVMFGTSAERLAITDKSGYVGLLWLETDTGLLFLCDGTYWYSNSGVWTLEEDKVLATEEGGFITTEDGEHIGIEVES